MNAKHTLAHANFEMEIQAKGAELIRFGKIHQPNLLWEKTTDHWNRVAPLLFPIVGKVKGNSYSFKGESFALNQHGFLRDQEFSLVEKTYNSLILEFSSNVETRKVYPFDFTFQIRYSLSEKGLEISTTVKNNGESPMYFSYGGHPAFHLADALQNYSLRFDTQFTAERHLIEDGLYSGKTETMQMDGLFPLSEDLFHSDAIVFKNPPFHTVELVHNTSGFILKMNCQSWTAIGIWTKPGAPFLCLEPWWGWADHHDSTGNLTQKPGIRCLEKGNQESFVYQLEVG